MKGNVQSMLNGRLRVIIIRPQTTIGGISSYMLWYIWTYGDSSAIGSHSSIEIHIPFFVVKVANNRN